MRLWTVHPHYLDRQGLTALWREALLAQAVLAGQTRGYRNHPQLQRFRQQSLPLAAIGSYLLGVHAEARARGYRFDAGKILLPAAVTPIVATTGQLALEWQHLLRKLDLRSPATRQRWRHVTLPLCHPVFRLLPGPVADWERERPQAPGAGTGA